MVTASIAATTGARRRPCRSADHSLRPATDSVADSGAVNRSGTINSAASKYVTAFSANTVSKPNPATSNPDTRLPLTIAMDEAEVIRRWS